MSGVNYVKLIDFMRIVSSTNPDIVELSANQLAGLAG